VALPVNIAVASAARVRPPGSDWLFVKLYGPRDLEDDLIVGAVRRWAMEAIASGMADAWFFLRYADPERHVRLRFHGEPRRLLQELLPAICVRASGLIGEGRCRRFAFETYERESERFGGSRAMYIAEDLFAADSRAVADLLHLSQTTEGLPDLLVLAVSTVDTILGGMGLDVGARMAWARGRAGAKQETSNEYRRRKDTLRAWLAPGPDHRGDNGRAVVAPILADLSSAVRKVNQRYAALAGNRFHRTPPLRALVAHARRASIRAVRAARFGPPEIVPRSTCGARCDRSAVSCAEGPVVDIALSWPFSLREWMLAKRSGPPGKRVNVGRRRCP
jgi:thiopeptide-type bacteriocin biosynthesis protein